MAIALLICNGQKLNIEAAGFPYTGYYKGLEDITNNVFNRLVNYWIDYKLVIEKYVEQGNTDVAYGTYSGIYKLTGKL